MIDLKKCKVNWKDPQIVKQFKLGSKVELEHTNNPWIANSIARQHICENPKYYTKLKRAGL